MSQIRYAETLVKRISVAGYFEGALGRTNISGLPLGFLSAGRLRPLPHGFLPIAMRAPRWYRNDGPKRPWNISRAAARKPAQPSGPRR